MISRSSSRPQKMTSNTVPLQVWKKMANTNVCQKLSEIPEKPINVKAFMYQKQLCVAASVCYSNIGKSDSSYIDACILEPDETYPDAVEFFKTILMEERRKYGFYKGVRVNVLGKTYQMGKQQRIYAGLPTVSPISLYEAKEYIKKNPLGWRSLYYDGQEPVWYSLTGHPVAVYCKDDYRTHMLLWRNGEEIVETNLNDEYELESECKISGAKKDEVEGVQMGLFS